MSGLLLTTPRAWLRRRLTRTLRHRWSGGPSWSPVLRRASARPPPTRPPRAARRCCWWRGAPTSWHRVVRDDRGTRRAWRSRYACDLTDGPAVDRLVATVLAEHGGVDYLVNNAGRSIRRSVALSFDRVHDVERTMAINYVAPGAADARAAPAHGRAALRPRGQRAHLGRAGEGAEVLRLHRVEDRARHLEPDRRSRAVRRRRDLQQPADAAGPHGDDRADRRLREGAGPDARAGGGPRRTRPGGPADHLRHRRRRGRGGAQPRRTAGVRRAAVGDRAALPGLAGRRTLGRRSRSAG